VAGSPFPIKVGIDLTGVGVVQASIDRHGDHYLDRVYTSTELADCRTATGLDAERLAARFAAKEAAMKVLAPDEHTVVPWPSIEVRRARSGSVSIELTGAAADLAEAIGLGELSVSLTHEADFAAAIVVANPIGTEEED
jgi:holo-[acyl-carrier protein] synthase